MVNFVRDFVPRCAELCDPLYRLTAKDAAFEWNESHTKAFMEIKKAIASAVTLDFVDPKAELCVFTDASDFGVGGILLQTINDKVTPLAFESKALTSIQRRWSVYEKEAWAIVMC
ncbi:hypothetical protein ADUPG1_005641, partial [Aduncisulcus paluster]